MPKFRELGGSSGAVTKWSTPGQVVEGVVKQLKRGKTFAGNAQPSMLAVIGDVTIGLPTALKGKFEENGIVPGHYVRITYLGEEKSKNSNTLFKNFKLEVDEEQGPSLAGVSPAAPAAGASAPTATASAGATEFDRLAAALAAKVTAGPAAAMLNAIKQIYKTEAEQTAQLRQACIAQGIAV